MKDPLGSLVRFAAEEINDDIAAFQTCVNGLSSQLPTCSKLKTYSSCVSTAANLLGELKVTKAVDAETKQLENGLDMVDQALSLVGDQCKIGCQSGVCSAEPRTFHVPGSCKCRISYSMALSTKISFTYMGCYVGTDDDVDEWSSPCPEAYASSVFDGAWFVRCVGQEDGQSLRLLDDGRSSSGGHAWLHFRPARGRPCGAADSLGSHRRRSRGKYVLREYLTRLPKLRRFPPLLADIVHVG